MLFCQVLPITKFRLLDVFLLLRRISVLEIGSPWSFTNGLLQEFAHHYFATTTKDRDRNVQPLARHATCRTIFCFWCHLAVVLVLMPKLVQPQTSKRSTTHSYGGYKEKRRKKKDGPNYPACMDHDGGPCSIQVLPTGCC